MPENPELSASGFVKIQFYEPDVGYENLWATPIGGAFRIESIPFFVYHISAGDIVFAARDPDGVLQFRGVDKKGGHKTVRVRMGDRDDQNQSEIRMHVASIGCPSECLRGRLLAVDVPEGVALETVATWLTESGFEWEYADPVYADVFPDEDEQRER